MSGLVVVVLFILVLTIDFTFSTFQSAKFSINSLSEIISEEFKKLGDIEKIKYYSNLYLQILTVLLIPDLFIIWRAFQRKNKHYFGIYRAFITKKGTRFCGADLTNVNFTGANLKSTDFRGANLTLTNWRYTKNLDQACVENSYLSDKKIRRLLVRGEANDENFDCKDLRGLNLSNCQLRNTSFIDAYLYQTNLNSSDLSGALLIRTFLEKADLTETHLTGACIQNWNIYGKTKLNDAKSNYIYMKFVDGIKQEKINFETGEFVTFIRSRLNSLELYQQLDINPDVAVRVLKSLSAKYQTPLQIVNLRPQGDKFIFQVKIAGEIEIAQEEIQNRYSSTYEEYLNFFIDDPKQFCEALPIKDKDKDKDKDEIKLLNKITELLTTIKDGTRQNTVINHIYNINQRGSYGIGVSSGSIDADEIIGTNNNTQTIMQLIESLRQQINNLNSQILRIEAQDYLDDIITEIQSPSWRNSRIKASLIILREVVKDTALVADAVTLLAETLDIQLPPLP